jgi:hypothetical protein
MTQRNLLANNRIFYDPGLAFYISANLQTTITASALTIPVIDTSNLMASGYAILGTPGSSNEAIYYTSKTANTLICPSGGRGVQGTLAQAWNPATYPYVRQAHTAPNDLIVDTQQAGWYVNPTSRQASLRVYDSPVILPGVIRFNSNGTGSGIFQGCTSISSNGIVWQNFSAEKGDPGTPGYVNTTLDFTYVGPTDISTAGLIVKTLSANVAASPFELRSIVAANTTINQVSQTTCDITTTSTTVELEPLAQPYNWDMSSNLSLLKGNPGTDTLLNAWGTTVIYCVEPGFAVAKGQAVMIQPFTNPGPSPATYLAIRPFSYSTSADLDPFKLAGTGLAMVGIARESGDATAETSITPSLAVPVRVIIDGHAIVKISANLAPGLVMNTNVPFAGRLCLLTTDGYGFNQNTTPIGYNVYQLGQFLETGSTVSTAGNYTLIKLMPQLREF